MVVSLIKKSVRYQINQKSYNQKKPNIMVISKHTEGNWMFKPSGDANFYFLQVESKTNTWLMNIQQNGELSDEEQIANVNLITTAPDMLKLLIEIKDNFEKSNITGNSIYHKTVLLINKLTK